MKKFLAVFILISSFFSSYAVASMDLAIDEQQVNQYLAKRAGVADSYQVPGLFKVNYTLRSAQAKIGPNNNGRVEINGVVESSLNLQNQQYAGQLNIQFDTIPYYDANKGAIYLQDLHILNWQASPEKYSQQLQPIMPFLIDNLGKLLSSTPVYTLDDTKARDVIIKKFAKGIRVEQGKLSVETK